MLARTALLFMCAAAGCAAARAPEERPQAPPARASIIALREDQIARLRQRVDTIERKEPKSFEVAEELGDALVALSHEYREQAIESDPRAASIPPPPDPGELRPDPNAVELDMAPEGESAPPARDAGALAELTPKARALLDLADRCAFEAVRRYDGIYGPSISPDVAMRIRVRRARLLDELGQRSEARRDWHVILRSSPREADRAEAWLAFSQWFVQRGERPQAQKAFDEASAAAARARDAKLLETVCARAREANVRTASCP